MKRLHIEGFDYMLTGALAASYYGQPRTTMDIDIVARVPGPELPRFFAALGRTGLEVNRRSVEHALAAGFRIITLQDARSPHQVDIILSPRKLRKRLGSILGTPAYYQAPEALLRAKLRMIKATVDPEKAAKHRQDVRSILRSTSVRMGALKQAARRDSTLALLNEFLP